MVRLAVVGGGTGFMPPRRARRRRAPAAPRGAVGAAGGTPTPGWALGLAVALTPLPPVSPPQATRVYDVHGELVGSWFAENRVAVSSSQIPQALKDATVAIEDERFHRHHGVDPLGILRALWTDLRAGRRVAGGSTITQQLAKNLYLTPRRTLWRKAKELVLALKLERTFTKDEILTMYLNDIYFGDSAWGVEAAAEHYFGKPASRLDLAESATLAGIIRSPAYYSPILHLDRARARRDLVLEQMERQGYISDGAARAARGEPLRTASLATSVARAGYFLDYVRAELMTRYPDVASALPRGGYRIYTTLDLSMQAAAEAAVRDGLPDGGGAERLQAALLAVDPATGAIRAYVGGRDYDESPFDRVRQARRQPGSAFKPFLYATVLLDGFPPTATQLDAPVSFPGVAPDAPPFTPANFDGSFSLAPVNVRDALAHSNNVVAARWMAEVTPRAVIATARAMGIESPLEDSIPLALGTSAVSLFEMVRAYTPLATLGVRTEPFAILRVEDSRGHVVVPDHAFGPHGERVLDPGVAYVTTDLLKSVLDYGTAAGMGVGRPAAGKTGTTRGDAWFLGYTPNLLAGVWVGYDDDRPIAGQGATLATPVWRAFMTSALKELPVRDWAMPDDVVRVRVAEDGLLAGPWQPSRAEVFLRGTEPTRVSPVATAPGDGRTGAVPGGPGGVAEGGSEGTSGAGGNAGDESGGSGPSEQAPTSPRFAAP